MIYMVDIYGTDINSSFTFSNGDIDLISGESNLAQAIINILNTDVDFYNWCYNNYGGNVFNVFGMKNNTHHLEYLKIEIEYAVKKDPRVKDLNVTCTKADHRTVNVDLDVLTIGSDEIVTLNLVIQDDLVVKLNTGMDNNLAMGDRV